ncbi:MAG: TonB family protein [bacterium]|nr:TonB family protein [bacterium]
MWRIFSFLIICCFSVGAVVWPSGVHAQRRSSSLNVPNQYDPFYSSGRLVGQDRLYSEIDSAYIAVPLDSIRPLYPVKALQKRVGGWVWIKIKMSPEGVPQQTEIVACHPEWFDFEPAAVKAVKQARFQPPPNTGRRKTSKWMHYIVNFDPYDNPYLGDSLPTVDSIIAFDTPASSTKPITIEILDAEHQIQILDTGTIKVLIDANGIPRDYRIVKSGGSPTVDSAAVHFVRVQQFNPATFGGEPIAMWVDVPFAYTRIDHFLAVPSVSAIAIPKLGLVLNQQLSSRIEIELVNDTAHGLIPLRPFYQNTDSSLYGLAERMLRKLKFVAPDRYDPKDSLKISHRCLFIPSQMPALNIDSLPSIDTDHLPDSGYSPPVLTYSSPINYHELARRYGLEATIEVAALVDADGSVRMATVTKESFVRPMNLTVVEAAISNRYIPAKSNGRPIAAWVTYKVEFRLE